MTKIPQIAFAKRIEEYLHNEGTFDQQRFDSSLYRVVTQNRNKTIRADIPAETVKVIQGLSFSDHIGVVMMLIGRAYRSLSDQTSIKDFARAIARALQAYAAPVADGDYACFPYPYFLLHGIERPTAAEIVTKLEKNGRIIHETLAARTSFIKKLCGPIYLEQETKMLMEEGAAEDTSGICCYLTKATEKHPHGTDSSYIAKVSFFLDTHNQEIIVITIQGQRVQPQNRERSRGFVRLGHKLQMDPRTYILKNICKIGRRQLYHKIRVIRPLFHPMYLDSHEGFMARYEPVIIKAGINIENGCYLEAELNNF